MIRDIEIIFKALGEPTRLKIVRLLGEQELCVCELEVILDMSQPRVSQHLRVLKQAGIVKERKERQKSFYRLNAQVCYSGATRFIEYMTTEASALPDLADELIRLADIDNHQAVRACKSS